MVPLKSRLCRQIRRRHASWAFVSFCVLQLAVGCSRGKKEKTTRPTGALNIQAAWWTEEVPSSGLVPAEENPDFDKYLAVSPPLIQGKNGNYLSEDIVAKGWDKTLKTFYVTFDVKSDDPIRVHIPEVPATLKTRTIVACTTSSWNFWQPKCDTKTEPTEAELHSNCKVLDVVDGKLLEVTGKVAMSMPTVGYLVGLPGSKLDVSGFADKSLPFAGRQWRAKAGKDAYIVVTAEELILKNVEEVH